MSKKNASLEYNDENMRQALALNQQGITASGLVVAFKLPEYHIPLVKKRLDELCEEGFAKRGSKSKEGIYYPVTPLSDLVIARVGEFLRHKDIELKIEGLPEDFPFLVTIPEKQVRKVHNGRGLHEGDRVAVVLSRSKAIELKARYLGLFPTKEASGVIKPPVIEGHFNQKAKTPTFVPYDAGITTRFNAVGAIPDIIDSRTSYWATLPDDFNPFTPTLHIGERKWDPETGTPIATIIAQKHGIKIKHSKAARREAYLAVSHNISLQNRRDLTHEKILVIDPVYAKDHDDGIMIERTKEGFRTLVVVSDIPYYVRPGSVLDEETRERGFTHYLPDETYHMLPQRLVDHASLKEGRAKPVIYVEQFWNEQGEPDGYPEIGAGVIAAQKQMTYGEFEDLVIGRSPSIASYLELGDILLEKMRFEKGLLLEADNLDLRNSYSQSLVQALMIEANSAIAEFLIYNNMPFLSRTHTGEDNIHTFLETKEQLEKWDYDVPDHIGDMNVGTLNGIIAEAERRGEKRMVEHFLRANFLHQACYSPIPYGHFGLNRENYTHATSPIRRRSDILTLRAVHTALQNHELGLSDEDMDMLANSARELNVLQNLTRQINTDMQKYYATRDLQRLDGHTVRAQIGKIDPYRVEIILPERFGLRKTVTHDRLPREWRLAPNNKSLIFNNIALNSGANLRLRIANVRPDLAQWDFEELEAILPKQKPQKPAFYAPSPQPAAL